jgi:hypothetical protein
MIIDTGWDFVSLACLRWGESVGTGSRQMLVLGDHHWWFSGTHDLITDADADADAWVDEILGHANRDNIRYIAVVREVASARLDYSPDAYPFDRLLRTRAESYGIHHMGCHFLDAGGWWCATGPMKTFSTYVGAEDYPRVDAHSAVNYPEPRRVIVDEPETHA